jgi:Sulfatase
VSAATYAYDEVSRIPSVIRDQRAFARAAAQDPLAGTPGNRLLTGLRGKDVLLVFVESHGRVAVQDSSFAPGVDAVLDSGTRRLDAAGFHTRSAFLTSPTFGAISWLAHSTLQSGLWIDSQQRYDVAVTSSRVTLSDAFARAGWRTVADVPADTRDWPQASFYGYDKVYDSRNVGYAGPRFGYPTMPDQYTLHAFHRLELAKKHRRPVMAEIDLVSSHAPWSRTPHMIPESRVGDGSAFDGMPERLPSQTVIWRSPERVRAAYGQSIEYSLRAVISFVLHHADRNTVLVVLGDHQPATIVTGAGADHDVPITVIARDRAVVDRIDGWGWQPGMRPQPNAPVWRMDAFRDRFLDAFGPRPGVRGSATEGSH